MNHTEQQREHLSRILEALLFVSGEPITTAKLSTLTKRSREHISEALDTLEKDLQSRSICLLRSQERVSLVTAPEFYPHVESLVASEFLGELSRAALETITIVAYQHPIGRSTIDYIRGVNSSFTLRNLVVRGLIERSQKKDDVRGYLYRPTMECMKHLGISSFAELPNYESVRKDLEKYQLHQSSA